METLLSFLSNWYLSSTIIQLTSIDFAIQWSLYIPAFYLQTEKFYDAAGSSTFIILACLNYKWNSTGHIRQYIQSFLVCLWALRLGCFLLTRILKHGKDRRFAKIKPNPLSFFCAWTLQGTWVIVMLLPTIVSIQNPRQAALGWRDYIGWSIWIFGFVFETVADYQKSEFRNDPRNTGKFIATGLWSTSRHPNYFGEILLWFGLYISASSNFTASEYWTVVCPIFNYLLITKISGIPLLESYGLKKWGNSPAYRQYIQYTPSLVPFIGQSVIKSL